MSELICLFGKWYNKKFFKYKTWCSNTTLTAIKTEDFKYNNKTRKTIIKL